MVRKILLKYYYVWFQAHKRSKYAHEFSHYWFSGFLQVCVTVGFIVINAIMILEKCFDIVILNPKNAVAFWTCFLILPSTLLYYLLFLYCKADKENDDPSHLGITITRSTKIISWIVFILAPLSFLLLIAIGIRK